MKRRWIILLAVLALMAAACGGNLGLGQADCASPANDISSSNILTVQAVPSAKYTPCLNELRVSWDSVDWFAEDGKAGLEDRPIVQHIPDDDGDRYVRRLRCCSG